ncbi:hypothetical protein CDO51_05090 [Natranaerobius trueperi]|uniref:HNH nuclease domain-containing protein n=2 Tax=Natranaerobius trueperi TaxID=759412 RepID=A0A226BYW6_9FIRM|nr:hypothetical protein CDO51_05090 [Natranaerobius trueperi]
MKFDLIDLLKVKNSLLDIVNTTYVLPGIKNVLLKDLINEEKIVYQENRYKTPEQIAEKIKEKGPKKKKIIVKNEQYYRDPDIISYAKKRANGVCECCGQEAPFLKDDGAPFLETHHLKALSEGGEDSIENVCAVCPNCHRKLHYSSHREELTKEVRDYIANIYN